MQHNNFEMNFLNLLRVFKGVLGIRFGSLESTKVILGFLESEKIGSQESEKSGPYRSILGT